MTSPLTLLFYQQTFHGGTEYPGKSGYSSCSGRDRKFNKAKLKQMHRVFDIFKTHRFIACQSQLFFSVVSLYKQSSKLFTYKYFLENFQFFGTNTNDKFLWDRD